jgi:hypothetical protein
MELAEDCVQYRTFILLMLNLGVLLPELVN